MSGEFTVAVTGNRFEIANRKGRVVWSAGGFATEEYLNEAVSIALRQLRGHAPMPVDSNEALKPATVSIIKSWVAEWHPNTKRA